MNFFDNAEELFFGFFYGLLSCFMYGVWGVLIAIACAFLWRLGGMYGHSIRVFGCPAVIILWHISWLSIACYIVSAIICSIGYSVPDVNQTKASPLGTFFYNKLNGKQPWVDICTRGTIYLLLSLALLPLL